MPPHTLDKLHTKSSNVLEIISSLFNVWEYQFSTSSSSPLSRSSRVYREREMIRQALKNSPPPVHQNPLFSCGLELADLVVSSDLLHRSWNAISALNNDVDTISSSSTQSSRFSIRYRIFQNIIAFDFLPCNQGEEVLIPSSTLEENNYLFEFLCSKGNPKFSINQEALTLFISLFDQLSDLQQQLGCSNSLIITGHSLGGSVASLFTLWLLGNLPPSNTNLPFCITFGAPLVGDDGLQQAISDYQTWNHRFLHVVSDQDIVPRLFISPHNVVPNVNSSLETSGYKPFGTFLMCSQSGCACFEDPESILDLMSAIQLEVDRSQDHNGGSQVSGCVNYGEVLENLKGNSLYKSVSELHGLSSSPRAEMSIQLEAVGLKNALQLNSEYDALITAMENREHEQANKRHISDPSKKLNDIKIYMANLEWYKKASKAMGYYDSYKKRGRAKQDMNVVPFKNELTNYWRGMVAEAERKPQKQGIAFRTRWLYGGTNYRRMVEPLDIADYYKVPGRKEYKTQGRSQHYILLERWQEEVEKASGDQKKANTRITASSLTEDSCFWANVEDAIIFTKLIKNGEETSHGPHGTDESYWNKLMKFESYVMGLIQSLTVSPEIFLEKSTFMQWWGDYELIHDHGYSSPLTEYMKSQNYKEYA